MRARTVVSLPSGRFGRDTRRAVCGPIAIGSQDFFGARPSILRVASWLCLASLAPSNESITCHRVARFGFAAALTPALRRYAFSSRTLLPISMPPPRQPPAQLYSRISQQFFSILRRHPSLPSSRHVAPQSAATVPIGIHASGPSASPHHNTSAIISRRDLRRLSSHQTLPRASDQTDATCFRCAVPTRTPARRRRHLTHLRSRPTARPATHPSLSIRVDAARAQSIPRAHVPFCLPPAHPAGGVPPRCPRSPRSPRRPVSCERNVTSNTPRHHPRADIAPLARTPSSTCHAAFTRSPLRST